MKQSSRNLQEFASELSRQNSSKHDYLVPTAQLTVDEGGHVLFEHDGAIRNPYMNPRFHSQLADDLSWPTQFYNRTRSEYPQQWSQLANAMLHSRTDQANLVRTMDSNARALLSNRYRILDNWDVAETALTTIGDQRGWTIDSAEITESKMYLKVLTPLTKDIVPYADNLTLREPVQAGFVLSNSEVGLGSASVEFLLYVLSCRNGMITGHSVRKFHLGSGRDNDGKAYELFSNETKRLTDAATLSQIRDVISSTVDSKLFDKVVSDFQATTGRKIEGDVPKAIEVVQQRFQLTEDEGNSVLRNLIEGKSLTQFGMIQAVTAAAQTVEDYSRSVELEQIGGKLLNLPAHEWRAIASAN